MKGTKVAVRYAQSLIELSEERNASDAVMKDMKLIIDTVNENRELTVFLNNPIIKADKKTDVLSKIFTSFDELTLAFIRLITKNNRESLLPVIAKEYIAKLKALRGIVPVTLTSAASLAEDVKDNIISKLQKDVEGKLEVTERIDPALIGGFVFRMGDVQIEASIARQLSELRNILTN
ncbi:MAG: ATP synthase F1 subunit delta [Crocinitomicaceae bacterium]|nr:ATP synthase F1 subunit delta [Crocinitomicaceae bacterium]